MVYDTHNIRLVKKPLEVHSGNDSEELLSYVILANIDLLCGKPETAGGYIENALGMAKLLERLNLDPTPHISKFACFTCSLGDTQQVLPFPIINNVLILPDVSITDVLSRIRGTLPSIISIRDLSVSYFRINLHIQKVTAALHNAATAANREKAIDILSEIIRNSLECENRLPEPLDTVSDYFFLARNLIKKGNITLTRLALAKADKVLAALDTGNNTLTTRQHKQLRQLKSELRIIAGAIH